MQKQLYEPKVLRAHRPADVSSSSQPHQADAQPTLLLTPSVTEDVPRSPALVSFLAPQFVPMGLGMLLVLVVGIALVQWVIPFTTQQVNHWQTGQVRITHYDLNVGHNGTSHFLTEYYHNQAIVIELTQDSHSAKVYSFRMTYAKDSTPRIVTIKSAYISLHPIAGKPDVVVQVEGFSVARILYNTGDSFSTEA